MEVKRICKKCLLRDAFPEDYEKYITSVVSRMSPNEKVNEEQYQERMNICRECEKLQNGTCMACGCMVEIRGIQKGGKCPYRRW